MGKQEEINRAQCEYPKDRRGSPAKAKNDAGTETLSHAVSVLGKQHSIRGKVEHEPLHGLHSKSKHGR
jgi:hypothetical protein